MVNTYKIVIAGQYGAGKTSIYRQYLYNQFTSVTESTLGAEFIQQKKDNGDIVYLWDTAGQERFQALVKNYFTMSDCMLIVYDITDKNSFTRAKELIDDIESMTEILPVMVLIGNKIDLVDRRTVMYDEAYNYAQNRNMNYYEVTAKNNDNIKNMFEEVLANLETHKRDNNSFTSDNTVLYKKTIKKPDCCT